MIEEVFLLSFVTASFSFTVTETKLFAPLRNWVKRKSAFFGGLIFCGYCFGHWIAIVLVAIYKPRLFNVWLILDYFLTAIVIAWFSAFQSAFLCWLMDKIKK